MDKFTQGMICALTQYVRWHGGVDRFSKELYSMAGSPTVLECRAAKLHDIDIWAVKQLEDHNKSSVDVGYIKPRTCDFPDMYKRKDTEQ